nr:hypothetical protein [Desulfobacterales bacterium]
MRNPNKIRRTEAAGPGAVHKLLKIGLALAIVYSTMFFDWAGIGPLPLTLSQARADTASAYLDRSKFGIWISPHLAGGAADGACTRSISTKYLTTRHTWAWDSGTFNIPDDATIDGLEVVVTYASKGDYLDTELSPDNSILGANWGTKKTFLAPPSELESCEVGTDTFAGGSASDLWGNSWTPANINDGLQVRITARAGNEKGRVYVDSVQLTVHYQVSSALTVDGGGGGDFLTISDALLAAGEGDTIQFIGAPGQIYDETWPAGISFGDVTFEAAATDPKDFPVIRPSGAEWTNWWNNIAGTRTFRQVKLAQTEIPATAFQNPGSK